MSKQTQEPDSELNMEQLSSVEADGEAYALEDILREFGGWTKRPEPVQEPPAPATPAEAAATPAASSPDRPELMRVAAQGRTEKPRIKLTDLSGDTIRFKPLGETPREETPAPRPAEAVGMPEEPDDDSPEQEKAERQARKREARRLQKLEKQRRRVQRAEQRAKKREEPEVVYPSPAEACAAYAKGGTLRLRLMGSAFLTALSAVLLVLGVQPVGGVDLTAHLWILSVAMLALLLVQSLLSADVFVRGIYQILRLRFDHMSLLVLQVLVTVADSFFAIPAGRAPLCAVPSVALLLALWSVALEKKAKWRTLKTVLSMDTPVAAVREEKAWRGLDCIFRQEGSLEDFTAMLESPDAAQRVMRVYAPIAAVLTLALAGFAAFRGSDFLWAWAALLAAALPVGGALSCCRPFSILARRLHRAGAAICGWRGAKILSGECGIVIADADLFPARNISMNGMKMYSDLPLRQVIGYATAVLQAAGSGLLPLFEEVMKNENGRRYTADTFRQYEGGGLGAEIRGDVVLLGSLPFMRLMGVHVPEGTRVQSAVYISVNKELTGVFALTYAPSSGSKSGLQSIVHTSGLTAILATRDFMITPGLVKKRYKVPADRLEFPVVAERTALSDPAAGQNGRQGALMARSGFAGFAAAVTGGRQLRKTVHWAVALSLLSGLLGMVLLCLLTYLDATQAASAVNLLLYQLLWLLPSLLITGLIGKT